jgi:hypothetical protein
MSKKRSKADMGCANCPYRISAITSYNACNPVFSLRHMRKKYNLSKCTSEEKQAFVNQMIILSQLTWVKIIQSGRHGLGSEHISQDAISGDEIPKDIIKPDTNLLALRFDGKKAMVGFREKDIFHILWFDRDYTLYKH